MNPAISEFQHDKAILVGVQVRGTRPLLSLQESLQELALLADTAGLTVVGELTQTLNRIEPATFIGSGKVTEMMELVASAAAGTVIFDDELSPRHQRELSEALGENIKLLDRSALILDIFAQHARTREGALQVELAQYEYRLPRLTRQWTHLARQAGGAGARGGSGGVGVRGPGETQLEVDRRDISRRIAHLKNELERVRQHRRLQRESRRRAGVPVVSLVGYTNAGKSTLMNTIASADVYVANQLFATLDPTTRRVELPSNRQVLFTDTVGFIQKLPPALIAAFRATLEEIQEADLILHVVDASHPSAAAQIEAVDDILAEIEVTGVPRLLVWNKLDQVEDTTLPDLRPGDRDYRGQVAVSALQRTGIAALREQIDALLAITLQRLRYVIPYQRGDVVSQLHEVARVLRQEHIDGGVLIEAEVPDFAAGRFQPYLSPGETDVPQD
ncbi:MAG: GTPase HflX [Anaerolineae bacterium]|nr:GTPase HflX [Anaerolineae bacterium]